MTRVLSTKLGRIRSCKLESDQWKDSSMLTDDFVLTFQVFLDNIKKGFNINKGFKFLTFCVKEERSI